MAEKLAPGNPNMFLFAGGVAAAAVTTALVMRFLVGASESFTLIVACLSIPATTLLLYLGLLMHGDPEGCDYLLPVKALAVLSLAMSGVIVLDFTLATNFRWVTVKGKIPIAGETVLYAGPYVQRVPAAALANVHEGDLVGIETTALLDRIESITPAGSTKAINLRSAWQKLPLAATALLFFLPVGMLKFSPRQGEVRRNVTAYLTLVVPSFILSLIASGLWIKLFLVHVVHSIDRM